MGGGGRVVEGVRGCEMQPVWLPLSVALCSLSFRTAVLQPAPVESYSPIEP